MVGKEFPAMPTKYLAEAVINVQRQTRYALPTAAERITLDFNGNMATCWTGSAS